MFVMVEGVKDELQAMRDGLTSIIPPEILEGLTAEVLPSSLTSSIHSIISVLLSGLPALEPETRPISLSTDSSLS